MVGDAHEVVVAVGVHLDDHPHTVSHVEVTPRAVCGFYRAAHSEALVLIG